MVANRLEPGSPAQKITSAERSWLRKNRLFLLGMFVWFAVCISVFVWGLAPREGVAMTLPELVKKLELSPKLLSFPARGKVNWKIHVPIQKMYKIRGELESVDAFARWHYREAELSKRHGGDFESYRLLVNSAAGPDSVESSYFEHFLPDAERHYHILLVKNGDSEGCSFLITTDSIRKGPEKGSGGL